MANIHITWLLCECLTEYFLHLHTRISILNLINLSSFALASIACWGCRYTGSKILMRKKAQHYNNSSNSKNNNKSGGNGSTSIIMCFKKNNNNKTLSSAKKKQSRNDEGASEREKKPTVYTNKRKAGKGEHICICRFLSNPITLLILHAMKMKQKMTRKKCSVCVDMKFCTGIRIV